MLTCARVTHRKTGVHRNEHKTVRCAWKRLSFEISFSFGLTIVPTTHCSDRYVICTYGKRPRFERKDACSVIAIGPCRSDALSRFFVDRYRGFVNRVSLDSLRRWDTRFFGRVKLMSHLTAHGRHQRQLFQYCTIVVRIIVQSVELVARAKLGRICVKK